jgi:hypothetical protein
MILLIFTYFSMFLYFITNQELFKWTAGISTVLILLYGLVEAGI